MTGLGGKVEIHVGEELMAVVDRIDAASSKRAAFGGAGSVPTIGAPRAVLGEGSFLVRNGGGMARIANKATSESRQRALDVEMGVIRAGGDRRDLGGGVDCGGAEIQPQTPDR